MIIGCALLIIVTLLAGIRFYLGPTFGDRVLVFDLLTSVMIGGTVLYAIYFDRKEIVSLVLVLAILSFVGTAALAYYLEQRTESDE
ncbi:hypothetical protein AZI86_02390 [Bdellovibrio bacteriovorus]|uniref:Cation:proton antiporter n=1 Tax=Bdellovibrio bacteriovorus TaxID=959 RepID=A0A150WNF6_BDEBC|nr:monovalent cation/H+ antiporter complex subunit F [Bdellovibrio bacteriovorus]KYG65940.1 hypothetical protein AZI86_02390 [Bdellovibrio bacteriovorus]